MRATGHVQVPADLLNTLIGTRLHRGLTQMQVGAGIGVSQTAISRWERALDWPHEVSLQRWAGYLGVAYIRTNGDRPVGVPPMHQSDATGRNLRIAGGVVDDAPAVAIEVRTHDSGTYRAIVTVWLDATTLDELVTAAYTVLRETAVHEAVREASS